MEYFWHIGILIAIYSILTVSLNYVAGYAGIISFSHASFAGIGAYATAVLTKTYGLSFLEALGAAVLLSMGIAYLASFFILRLREDSLMLVSFGFALIMYNVFLNWTELTNGPLGIKGIPAPALFGWEVSSKASFFLLSLAFLLFTFFFLRHLVISPYGRIIRAIRENEVVVRTSGYASHRYKRSVFITGAAFAGVAGSLFATHLTFIEPSLFQLFFSVLLLIMVLLGGLGTLWGPVAGAAILLVIPELLRFADLPSAVMAETQQILYGLILFGLMLWRPQGLFGKYIV